jgi:NTP pyrophosphatase (non-canonical NTP hydrolase)
MTDLLGEWQAAVHANSRAHGFWPEIDDNGGPGTTESRAAVEKAIPLKLALIHSEISEALEEYRGGRLLPYCGAGGKPEGFGVELADAVIRILDLAEALEIDLEAAIVDKHEFNVKRPYRHGGKRA